MHIKSPHKKVHALVLNPADTVGVMLEDVKAKTEVHIIGAITGTLIAAESIQFGHKIALCDHQKGDVVRKYGEKIGCTTTDFQKGSRVHIHNLISSVDRHLMDRLHSGKVELQ